MLSYKYGFQLDVVRKLAKAGRIQDPVIVHHQHGYTFFFNLSNEASDVDRCVLITVKGAKPREFKKARTYSRVLKANGINRWRVSRLN